MEQANPKPVEQQPPAPVAEEAASQPQRQTRAERRRLPDERRALTHHFTIGCHEGYLTVGLHEDGSVGEMFIKMSKEGSTVSGLMDSFATAVSLALQHGVPLAVLCEKFSYTRFEPSGWTGNPEIGHASSIMDYLFRYLRIRFLSAEQRELFQESSQQQPPSPGQTPDPAHALGHIVKLSDAPACVHCGSLMVPNGAHCFRCEACGHTVDVLRRLECRSQMKDTTQMRSIASRACTDAAN